MGTNSKLHVQFRRRAWIDLGSNGRDLRGHRLPEHVGGHACPAGTVGDPGRLHGRPDRSELRQGHARNARGGVPEAARARPPGDLGGVERPGDRRLLAWIRVDAWLLLVLEGRPVHRVRRGRGSPGGQRALLRGAHLDRLPGVPERCRRGRRAGCP
jgi:hypothetical protein